MRPNRFVDEAHKLPPVPSPRKPLSPDELSALDATLRDLEEDKWQAFYNDREKPCPFFVTQPDECLAEWIAGGCVPRGRALDIGCGNGRNAIYLARQGFQVDAIDLSSSAISWAQDQVEHAGVKVNLACGSIFAMGVPANTYSLVYDSGCFHHIAPHRRNQYVQLIAGALTPGGALGIVCFTPEAGSGYSDEEVYAQKSLGGGLGYSDAQLRAIWAQQLRVSTLRRMHEREANSGLFGRAFLWAMLAHRDVRPYPSCQT